MKLSTSTGDFKLGPVPIDEKIRLIGKSGFRHINLELTDDPGRLDGDDWEEKIERIRVALEESGTDCVLAHAVCERYGTMPYEEIVEETRRDIVACERLGIPDLVVHPLYPAGLGAAGIYSFNRQFYADLYATRPDTPVHLLVENMADTEFAPAVFSSGEELLDFLNYTGDPRLGACWDTAHGNLNRPPRDDCQYTSIKALGDRLRALHVSDNFGKGLHWHSFPFNGSINFDQVLCALTEIGYKGAFNFEASYIMRSSNFPPVRRKPWTHPTDPTFTPKLLEPSLELRMQAERLLYSTGKYLLEQYGVFED